MATLEDTKHDVCTPTLAGRVAAMLDVDPASVRHGNLPRGWHVALFTASTPHSALRPDGLGSLGVTLPDLGLPRLVAGGRRLDFHGDIPIGVAVHRVSRTGAVTEKQGRSGRLAVVSVEHEIFVDGIATPALTERQDYVMLPEAAPDASTVPATASPPRTQARFERTMRPDEAMLLRYCAITFNTHRIHYDHPYATQEEGYPALVVNGGIPVLFLLQLFRAEAGREPAWAEVRNKAPLFCRQPLRLCAVPGDASWRLWAEDDGGRAAVEMSIG